MKKLTGGKTTRTVFHRQVVYGRKPVTVRRLSDSEMVSGNKEMDLLLFFITARWLGHPVRRYATILLYAVWGIVGCPASESEDSKRLVPASGCSVCPPNTACQSIEGEDTVVLCVPGGSNPDIDLSNGAIDTAADSEDTWIDVNETPETPDADSGECMDFSCDCESGEGCFTGLCLPAQFGGTCTIPCQTQCPANWLCVQILLDGESKRVCIPTDTAL